MSGTGPIDVDEARSILAPAIGHARALIAVSGGPDSVALMRLCASVAQQCALPRPSVATVDHGLRAGSIDEAKQVSIWARDCGLDHVILPWTGPKPSAGLQERARSARYRLLVAHARETGASLLLTAHTKDDQAETILMRLARGSGLSGLSGMRAVSRREGLTHLRPLLGIAKRRLVETCSANKWLFIEDPSNTDPRFARARWRTLMPTLAGSGLTISRLARLADRLALADDALEQKAGQALAAALRERSARGLVVDIATLLAREPREIVLRVLLRSLAEVRTPEGAAPIRLLRAEAALQAIDAACAARRSVTRTLAGTILSYDGERFLTLRREGPRRRGAKRGGAPDASTECLVHRQDGTTNQGNTNAWLPLA